MNKNDYREHYRDLFAGAVYRGETNSKNTSIVSGVALPIKNLFLKGKIYGKVIDYGCGQVDRNGKYLRENGLKVYSYDLNWGTEVDGYSGISNIRIEDHFDVGYTSYVLNVVGETDQEDILKYMDVHCDHQYNVVRNMDVYPMLVKALERRDKTVMDFYLNKFGGKPEDIGNKEVMMAFAKFGTKTSKGFQRIVYLEGMGYRLIEKSTGFKIYEK